MLYSARTALVAAALLGLAGCGSSGSSSSSSSSTPTTTPAAAATSPAPATSAATTTVKLSADPSGALAFDKKTLTAKAGKVTVEMANPAGSGVPHAIAIEGNGVDKDGATASPGSSSSVTLTLKPGKYQFYCPIPGHEAAGMKGTLTVE